MDYLPTRTYSLKIRFRIDNKIGDITKDSFATKTFSHVLEQIQRTEHHLPGYEKVSKNNYIGTKFYNYLIFGIAVVAQIREYTDGFHIGISAYKGCSFIADIDSRTAPLNSTSKVPATS